jgi:urea transporter
MSLISINIEWAVTAHFAFDTFVSMILIPVYFLKSPAIWAILIFGLIVALAVSWRILSFVRLSEV